MCLCRLHNFCIGERLVLDENTTTDDDGDDILPSLAVDTVEISAYGGIRMEKNHYGWNDFSPDELLGGGHHFNDHSRNYRRQRKSTSETPRDYLFKMVVQQGLKRPTPRSWKD